MVALIFGALVVMGILQWAFVLRRYVANSALWIPFAGTGWLIALFVGTILSQMISLVWRDFWSFSSQPVLSTINQVMFGMMLGLSIGFLQWYVLRSQIASAIWWLRACLVSYGIGVPVFMGFVFARAEPVRDPLFGTIPNVPLTVIGTVLASIIIGAITGIAMVRLLRDRLTK